MPRTTYQLEQNFTRIGQWGRGSSTFHHVHGSSPSRTPIAHATSWRRNHAFTPVLTSPTRGAHLFCNVKTNLFVSLPNQRRCGSGPPGAVRYSDSRNVEENLQILTFLVIFGHQPCSRSLSRPPLMKENCAPKSRYRRSQKTMEHPCAYPHLILACDCGRTALCPFSG